MKRQGDILFIPVTEIPSYEERQIVANRVIALGESTGHSHTLEEGLVIQKWNEMYLVLDKDSRVVHQEHNPIELPAGYYLVRRQREYVAPGEERTIYD